METRMSEALHAQGSKEQAIQNGRRLLPSDPESAERQARIIIEGDSDCVDAHSLLGMALRRQCRVVEARQAEQKAIDLSMLRPPLFEAVMTLAQQQPGKSQRLSLEFLREHPDNAAAMRLVAEVAARMGQFEEAERFIEGALCVAPDYDRAISLRATVQALREAGADREAGPFRSRMAWPETAPGQRLLDEGIQLYEATVQQYPEKAEIWVGYGHVLRTIGAQDEAVAKYRRAIEARATFGEAWCAIGDLKSSRFTAGDVDELKRLVKASDVSEVDRAQLHFALGRAFEQFGDFKASFDAYAEGNRQRSQSADHDADAVARHVDRSVALFDREYFARRAGRGEPSRDPIFVLGLPRSGSTLLEQILSTHPQIEATGELSDIPNLADLLADGRKAAFQDSPYLESLSDLPGPELQRLGRAYLWNAGLKRRTNKPLFVDKMPNNWLHLGFILSILPNAKVIDARRHPIACCFSNFRQYFASGQEFTYDLRDIGRFYVDYARMMAHFDAVAPGRIHRVIHEDLVAEPEAEIRQMLDYVGVEFHEDCLRFHENKREVRTASSEQVRRPINREGVDQWRAFEPWLGPLREVLGSIADTYPALPNEA
jgi:tetratricopeptide (TPR) repeat protein